MQMPNTSLLRSLLVAAALMLAAAALPGQTVPRRAATPDGRAHYYVKLAGEEAARVFERTSGSYFRGYRFLAPGGTAEARQVANQIGAASALAHSRMLDAQQLALAGQLEVQFGATILFRAQSALNGLAILARPEQLTAIRALPGVISVAPIHLRSLLANTSVENIGTRNFWDPARLNGLGQGIGVAVIDSGIDFVHAAFGGGGVAPDGTFSSGYHKNATSIAGTSLATTFPTPKVVWGWDLVGDAYNGGVGNAQNPPSFAIAPDPNPMDPEGHGTGSASLLAANGSVLANSGLPLGSTYPGPYNGTLPVIVGPGSTILVPPGIAPAASLYALKIFGNTGLTAYVASALDLATAVRLWQLSPAGTPLPPALAALTGAAPVPRTPVLSICSLSVGADAGFDHPGDADTDAALGAHAAGMSVVVATGNGEDNYYVAAAPGSVTSVISVAATLNGQDGQPADSVPFYSSRGPRRSDNKLKPDIAGPAQAVAVARSGTGGGDGPSGGTSASCPIVAGALALLQQLRPGYSPEEYKALLLNSVRVDPRVDAAGAFYGLSRVGAGRVTLNPEDGFPTALAMSSDPDAPVHVSWGLLDIPVNATQTFTKSVRVVNKENFARAFQAALSSADLATTPGATFSLPDGPMVQVPANGEATLRVQITAIGSALRHARDPQIAAVQGTFARNFIAEASSRLTFTEVGGPGHRMRLAVHAVVRPTSALAATPAILPISDRNPMTELVLAGTGIETGPNTNVLTHNPADIVSQAKAFELQYVNETRSGTVFEQGEIRYVGVTSDFQARANPFDQSVANNQSAVVVFAVAMHRDYAFPGELGTQVRILIDRDRIGATNVVVRNFSPRSFTSNLLNVFRTGTSTSAGSPANGVAVISTGYFANLTTGVANNVMNTNLAMLPVNLRQLGLSPNTVRFNYQVEVSVSGGDGPGMVTRSPWLSYDVSRPGIDASSPTGLEPFVASGQDGTRLPLATSVANFRNNASLGVLVFYPHNAPGERAQAIPVLAPNVPLTVAECSPTSGPIGSQVTLRGTGFLRVTDVSLRGFSVPFVVVDDRTLMATIAPGVPAAAVITVSTPSTSAASPTRFTVTP